MGTKKLINSESITDIFGLNSNIYHEFMSNLKDKASKDKSYEINLRKWTKVFTTIYGKEISSELFLKHTYFAVILRIIVVSKVGLIRKQSFEEIYDSLFKNELKNFKIFEFDFLFWIDIKKELFKKVYTEIQGSSFEKQDIFSQFYQQIFFSDLRHKRGEFFTPTSLVLKMIDDFYEFGLKILDPTCGSGNFLVNIIIKILKTQNPLSLKIKAISNVFGFDINPLAVITAKTNIFLLFLEFFNLEDKNLPTINIFLIDSLFLDDFKNKRILVIGDIIFLMYNKKKK